MELDYYMSASYEHKINMRMMYYDYIFPLDEILEYVNTICEFPIELILKNVYTEKLQEILPVDVFQFSNFDDATLNLCEGLRALDNPGLKYIEIGKLLLNDGILRKDGAYTKYGENHAKTGVAFGLIQELSRTYFLSCIGMVYPIISEIERKKLLTRLILRNKLIKRILNEGKVENFCMRKCLNVISDSTYLRRSSNIRAVVRILQETDEYDFKYLDERIDYSVYK